jgi:hypothetical protein|tara:strand:- start:840 stop:1217 length:378 start_codon:yes stop_codon:yes gene_type:complete
VKNKLKGLKKLVGSLSPADKKEIAKSMKDGGVLKMAGGGATPKSGVVKVDMEGNPKSGVKKMMGGGKAGVKKLGRGGKLKMKQGGMAGKSGVKKLGRGGKLKMKQGGMAGKSGVKKLGRGGKLKK